MKIFSTSQIREIERYTMENEPISSFDLMERAALSFALAFEREVSRGKEILIFAGPGNNGGDALAVARLLNERAYNIECFLFNPKNSLSSDCEKNKEKISAIPGIVFHEIQDTFVPPQIKKETVVIDGIFGTGLNRPLEGGFAAIIKYINQAEAEVYSIDIPSGLFGENNAKNQEKTIIKAKKTFTFQYPKLAFLLPDSAFYVGEWEILDIGLNDGEDKKNTTPYYITEKEMIQQSFHRRSSFAYKNQLGHALIIAGSRGKMGASVLCAKACLRSGIGLLTVHLPQCGEGIIQTAFPEAMVDSSTGNHCIEPFNLSENYTAIGVGPGIGTSDSTASMLKKLLQENNKPMVLDADALNILAANKDWLQHLPPNSILTPHVGELDRLVGSSISSFDRLMKASNFAFNHKCIVVLKGAFTAICTPEKTFYFNPTGNPGMATAGSGDVLTGIITGLLAQGYPPFKAAQVGVYLHGLAGDFAAEKHSKESMIAGDIIDSLGKAYHELCP